AHVDLFAKFALAKAAGGEMETTLERAGRWFCKRRSSEAEKALQREKLLRLLQAFTPAISACVSYEDLCAFDDVLARNLEDISAEWAAVGAGLQRRRFQGIFPCKDLLQHSCQPNCVTISGPERVRRSGTRHPDLEERLVMEIVTIRDIAQGERLTWSYLPHWRLLWPTPLRRWALQKAWGFKCFCERCSGKSRELVVAFRCPSCGQEDLCPERGVGSSE
ncbi:unnamed protein product, partial [Polarella glacialis]